MDVRSLLHLPVALARRPIRTPQSGRYPRSVWLGPFALTGAVSLLLLVAVAGRGVESSTDVATFGLALLVATSNRVTFGSMHFELSTAFWLASVTLLPPGDFAVAVLAMSVARLLLVPSEPLSWQTSTLAVIFALRNAAVVLVVAMATADMAIGIRLVSVAAALAIVDLVFLAVIMHLLGAPAPPRWWRAAVVDGVTGLSLAVAIVAAASVRPWTVLTFLPPILLLTWTTTAAHRADFAERELDAERERSSSDPLTGVRNRRGLESWVGSHARAGASVAVLACDIDHFKRVNDTYGHDRGDEVLQATAHVLRSATRATDCIARLGGEEFVVVLQDVDVEAAARIARRINALLRETTTSPTVTISIGVATGTIPAGGDHDTAFADVVRAADAALYTAKRSGRDRTEIAPSASA